MDYHIDTPYKEAWEWHKSGKLKDKPPKGNKFEEWLKKVGLPLNTTNVEALRWYMNKKYGKREPSGLGAEAGPVDIIKPAPNLTGSEIQRRKKTVEEVPLWQYKDIKADTYSQYTDKFLEAWFDRIEGVGSVTSKQLQDLFRNFKLGYRGEVFSK